MSTLEALIETIKPATVTKQVTDTGHHCFKGRAEFIHKWIDDHGMPKTKEEWKLLVAACKARYPQNASPVNITKTAKAYDLRKQKAAEKAAAPAVTETKSETKSSKRGRSVKPQPVETATKSSKSKGAKRSSKREEVTVAA